MNRTTLLYFRLDGVCVPAWFHTDHYLFVKCFLGFSFIARLILGILHVEYNFVFRHHHSVGTFATTLHVLHEEPKASQILLNGKIFEQVGTARKPRSSPTANNAAIAHQTLRAGSHHSLSYHSTDKYFRKIHQMRQCFREISSSRKDNTTAIRHYTTGFKQMLESVCFSHLELQRW